MKTKLLLSTFIFFSPFFASAQDFEWVKQYTGGNTKDVETDANGNTFVIASYVNAFTCGADVTNNQGSHPFTAKYDAMGNCLWMKPRPYEHNVSAMDEGSNIYIAGIFPGTITYEGITLTSRGVQDIYLAKYNSSGTFLWVKQLGGPGMEMLGDIEASNGNVYLTGSFGTSIQVNDNVYNASNPNNSNNFFLAKFDVLGNFSWLRKAISNQSTAGWKVGCDDNGNAYVHGEFSDTVNFGASHVEPDGSEFNSRFVVKYNAAGTDQWALSLGNNFRTTSHQMKSDKAGNVYVGWGFVYGQFTIKKYDTNGNFQWAAGAGGDYSTGIQEFRFNSAGDLYVTGNMWPGGTFGDQVYEGPETRCYVTKITPQGHFVWTLTAVGTDENHGPVSTAISLSNNGKVYMIGDLNGNEVCHFGSLSRYATNGNIFLAKIDEGRLISATDTWKYLDNGSNQGTNWRNLNFDDDSWKNGKAQLGYGDGDEATVVSFGPNASAKYITTYFRKTITISSPNDYASFELSLLKDDGAVVYLNGLEIARSNMPSGSVSYTTFASSTLDGAAESAYTNFTIPVAKFNSGENIIAVEVHQANRTSSDISFNLKLKGIYDNNPPPATCQATGSILREFWTNVPGDHVSQVPVNNPPTGSSQLSIFEGPVNSGDNYADRIRGYVCPPVSGSYTFWIAADDDAELWLSNSENPANKVKIAFVSGWTNSREWTKYPSQQSSPVSLVAGIKYYIETLHKEATGGDNLAVGWQIPGGVLERPIAGTRLSPFVPPAEQNLVSANASWKYLDNGSNQGTGWRAPSFNDGGWKSGNAELGYGDGGEATLVSYGGDVNNKYITTYFRKSFSVSDTSAFSLLELSLVRDDGAVVYLNGSEIYRNNMPSGSISYLTLAPSYIDGANESAWITTNVSKAKLVQGNNVLAVEIHQNSHTSSDISFNLKLRGLHQGNAVGKMEPEAADQPGPSVADKGELMLYPNPNTGSFTMEYCNYEVKESNMQIEVVSAVGQVVYQKVMEKKYGCVREMIVLDKGIAPGLYFMNITLDGKTESKRIVLTNQ
jgi:hypothetical protein